VASTSTILNRLIASLSAQDPTWDIGVGTAEYKILEAVANEIATAANNNTLQNYSFDITTKTGADLDNFCSIFGIYRNLGKRATGTATFSTATSGLVTGTLGCISAPNGGTYNFTYTPTAATSVSVPYNASASTIQSAISAIVPSNIAVNVNGTNLIGGFKLTFTPPLPQNSFSLSSTNLTPSNVGAYFSANGGATANLQIASGTQIYASANATGSQAIYYQTTAPATILQGQSSVTIPIQAINAGSVNNLAAGLVTYLSTQITLVTSVTNSILTGGTDAETDAQLIQRWQNTVFKNLAGTQDQFLALAFNNPDTTRAHVLGPQTQNTETIQIQTILSNNQKTGISLSPGTTPLSGSQLNNANTIATLTSNPTGAGTSGTTLSYNFTYNSQLYSNPFIVGDFVIIEGITETTGSSVNNTYNTSGTITAVTNTQTSGYYTSGNLTIAKSTTASITTTYTGATITRLPNSSSVTSANAFGLQPQVTMPGEWPVVTGTGVGATTTVTIPSGQSAAGAINGTTATSAGYITTANAATINAMPVANSDGTTTINLIQGSSASGTLSPTSSLTSITFSVPNNTTGAPATTNYSGTSTLQKIQNDITQLYTYSPSVDPNQIVTLNGFYNSATLNIIATGGSFSISSPSGTSSISLPFNTGPNATANTFTITLVTSSSGSVQYTTGTTSHGFSIGQTVTISGITPSGYNGTFTIVTVPSATTFTVANATTGAYTLSSAKVIAASGLRTVLNTLLSYYGIQCSVFRTTTSNGYQYIVDFYAKNYGTSIDALGNYYYSYIPVDANYVTTLLTFNFGPLNGTSPSGTWVPGNGLTGTVAQTAAINFLYAQPTTMPLYFTNSEGLSTITAVTQSSPSSGYVQYTTSAAHGFVVGQTVTISGITTPSGYNGTFTIYSIPSSTTFTVANATTGAATLSSAKAIVACQLIFQQTGQLLESITSSISESQYFYPQGYESIESTYTASGSTQVASPSIDYTYDNTVIYPPQVTARIVNGNNYSWLYPGNILNFTYSYVDQISRNIPTTFTGKAPSIYTNYVDVIIDGVNAKTVIEDGVINTSIVNPVVNPVPGSGGLITATNQTQWVLGDQISNPPIGDYFYSFSQQPVTQPWVGIYPEGIALGPISRTDTYNVSTVSSVSGNNLSQQTVNSNGYCDVTLSTVNNNFAAGPATFTVAVGGTTYQIWYEYSYPPGSNTVFKNCIILTGGGSVTIPANQTINQYQINNPNATMGDIGANVSGTGFSAGTTIVSVIPGSKAILSSSYSSSPTSMTVYRPFQLLTAYGGPLSVTPASNNQLINYELLPANIPGSNLTSNTSTFASNTSAEPNYQNIQTTLGSNTITTSSTINSIYYNMTTNLPNFPYPAEVYNYSHAGKQITLEYNNTNVIPATGARSFGSSNSYIFTSDFYPIYDTSEFNGSTVGISGIGIRQPTVQTRTNCAWNIGSNVIYDAHASTLDLGSYVVVPSGATLPQQAYIVSVTPNYSYTIAWANSISSANLYGYTTLNSSATNATLNLIPFSTVPIFPVNTNIQLFGINYNVNKDVQEVDSLIQQQRLVGVSTLTHGADFQQILLNLAVVPSPGVSSSSIASSITSQINSYFNNLQFLQPIQISSILQYALNAQGVQNVRLANQKDSLTLYGIQIVNPYMHYDSMSDLTQGNIVAIDYQDLVILNTFTKDVILESDQLPKLFYINLYVRSEGDF